MKEFFKTLASDEALKQKVIRASLFFILAIGLAIGFVVFYLDDERKNTEVTENQIGNNHIPESNTIINDKRTVYDFQQNEKNRTNRDQEIASQDRYFNLAGQEDQSTTNQVSTQNNTAYTPPTSSASTDPFADYNKNRGQINTASAPKANNNYTVSHSQYGTKDMWSVNQPTQSNNTAAVNAYNNNNTPVNTVVETQEVAASKTQSKKDLFEKGAKGGGKGSNFKASIRGTQDLKAGQILRFQTDEEFFVNGEKIPKNTSLFGVLSISKYRADIYIENANINGKIIAVNLSVYGNDGIKGIPIYTDEPIKDARDKTVNEAAKHAGGGGIVGTAASILGGVVSTKAKDPVVKFIDNQKIILVQNKKSF